jgi:methylated-DNA-[protein]-cysteine S-methyltransferase
MNHYALFDTPIGTCGIVWNQNGIVALQLPEKNLAETEKKLLAKGIVAVKGEPPSWIKAVIQKIQAFFLGESVDFSNTPLDLSNVSPFHQKVYQSLMKIPFGSITTYGELAKNIGTPNAARAVGQAMACNPFPLLVPCHRVVGAQENLGGFSAYGKTKTKRRLLKIEGIKLKAKSKKRRKTTKCS